jgi:flavodoxin
VNTLVVYFTKFGHTQHLAETMGEELATAGNVRVVHVEKLNSEPFSEVDLVVMGTPTHRMNLPEAVRPVFGELPKRILRGKNIAAFDTSYKMSPFLERFTAAKKLDRKLRKLGGKRLVKPETFHVQAREGPLFDGELERARVWARALADRHTA